MLVNVATYIIFFYKTSLSVYISLEQKKNLDLLPIRHFKNEIKHSY